MDLLYVGCSGCKNIVPLYCVGKFMFHGPIPVINTYNGIYCQVCGLMAPFFTCTICGLQQMMFIQGSNILPTQSVPGLTQHMAPVIQANPNASPEELKGKVSSFVKDATTTFVGAFGKSLASSMVNTWMRN